MTQLHASHRFDWADRARGICMLAILLFHTEKYYAGEEIIPYALYVDNALITFFLIAGYLFQSPEKPFSRRQKLLSVLRGIILPYLIFTAIIAFPKAWVHEDATLADTLTAILTGHASWFIAALAVAEVLFAFFISWWGHRPRLLGWMCAAPYLLIAAACQLLPQEGWETSNLWCWHNALLMLPFIFMGYLCRKYPTVMEKWLQWPLFLALIAIELILKCIIGRHALLMTLQPIHVSSFALLFVDGMLGAMLIISLSMRLPRMRWVEWTGAHSLIYYFICGGVPLMVTRLLTSAGWPYHDNYLQIVVAFICVWMISTAVSFFILCFYNHKRKK